ncbi:MAG: PD-(D/E)XK nuclease domain-containing protein, partial [Deltaproteobacteria bacterium]|nr:PD-(D/E)XK nuclease domain-containing protein [Deltaproteobacteria bacterium]
IHSSLGRSDLAIEHKGLAYVIEMKVVGKSSQAGTAARSAIQQIIEIGYAGRYASPPILMSLVVAEDARNIAACVFAREGQAERLEFGVPLKKQSNKHLKEKIKDNFDKNSKNKPIAVSQLKKNMKGPRP